MDKDETNWKQAKEHGIHHVRFCARSHADSKKMKVKDCAHWPEIHEFKRDGETMGPIAPTKPTKVEKLLDSKPFWCMWYQDTINLFDMTVDGPFDFEAGHKVPSAVWNELLSVASDLHIHARALNRVVPLDKPNQEDRDDQRNPTTHLSFRWNTLSKQMWHEVK